MRTKKIFLNMICDILPYLLIGVVGIIKMDVLIKYIGDVGNGYYQTINQIISYVFLAQAGFSDAVIYSLYKPFAEKNKDDINAIYGGARKVFRKKHKHRAPDSPTESGAFLYICIVRFFPARQSIIRNLRIQIRKPRPPTIYRYIILNIDFAHTANRHQNRAYF